MKESFVRYLLFTILLFRSAHLVVAIVASYRIIGIFQSNAPFSFFTAIKFKLVPCPCSCHRRNLPTVLPAPSRSVRTRATLGNRRSP